MRVPYRYAAPWFGYWSYLSDRSMTRWRRMSDEVECRKYGSDKLLCDVLQFWSEATNGWIAAVRSGSSELPCAFFLLDPRTQCDCKEIDFFAPACPDGDPEVAYLYPIAGGNPEEINPSKVTLCVSPSGHSLIIHLDHLHGHDGGPLTEGVYKGLIHIGEEPIAQMIVKVACPTSKSPHHSNCPKCHPHHGHGHGHDQCGHDHDHCGHDHDHD